MVKSNLKDYLIILLLVFIIIGQFRKTKSPEPIKIITSDTSYYYHSKETVSKPQVIRILETESKDSQLYLPDTNYFKLRAQYEELKDKFLEKKVLQDSLKIDSIGNVSIIDTLYKNDIISRKWNYNIKEKIINTTTTIYEPYKPKNQIFTGVQIGGTPQGIINQADLFIQLKNKRDKIFQISGGYNLELKQPQIKIGFGTKIKL